MSRHIIFIRPLPMKREEYNQGKLVLPFGLLFLSESLINNGYNVDIIDSSNGELLRDVERIINDSTLAIGISTMSGTQLANAIQIAMQLKKGTDKFL